MIINDLFNNKKFVAEGMSGNVVFSGTGADGGKYEIIQSSPTDFMIHANGRHIDTYGSLQRAMSVLKNEVPGLQQGVAEGEVIPFKRPQPQTAVSWQKLPKDVLTLANDWFWADYEGGGFDATMDPKGLGSGFANQQKYLGAQLQQRGWAIDIDDEFENVVLKNKQGQTILLPIEDAQTFSGWATGTNPVTEQGVAEGSLNEFAITPDDGSDGKQVGRWLITYMIKDGTTKEKIMVGKNANAVSKYFEFKYRRKPLSVVPYFDNIDLRGSLGLDEQGMAEGDGFDVVSNYQNMRTTDTGNKSNQTYTSTAIAKNPATGQQKSLASWDHTDPKTGKNYSGTNYIDPQGNAEVQKNYEESKNKVNEVSLGDYRKKAMMSKAMAQTNKFFDRDNPAKVAAADRTIANRTKGLAGADARRKPYTQPPVDQDKQRRDLADKYPNIDELVRQAELRRDPQYDRADGPAYYDGRDAEHNYHRLKQIQRMIRGAELDEMNFGGVSQTTDSDTGDVTTSFNQGPMSVSQTKTPGGYTKQTDQRFDLGPATMAQKTVGPNIGAGQLAGTTTRTATNNMTGQSQQQVRGVGFGGATGANVGKNYVGSSDDDLAQHAASVFKENVDLIKHLAGVKPSR